MECRYKCSTVFWEWRQIPSTQLHGEFQLHRCTLLRPVTPSDLMPVPSGDGNKLRSKLTGERHQGVPSTSVNHGHPRQDPRQHLRSPYVTVIGHLFSRGNSLGNSRGEIRWLMLVAAWGSDSGSTFDKHALYKSMQGFMSLERFHDIITRRMYASQAISNGYSCCIVLVFLLCSRRWSK